MENLNVTFTTVASKDDAIKLSELVINEKLAACVQIDEIESMYFWEGKMITDTEFRLMIKHLPDATQALTSRLKAIHPYEVPEILTMSGSVNEEYKKWCDAYCSST